MIPSNVLKTRYQMVASRPHDQCTWAVFNKDGEVIRSQHNSFCFGELKSPGIRLSHYFYVWTSPIKLGSYNTVPTSVSLEFYNWLLNSSVWADVFYTKDPEEFYKIGGFLNTNFPASHVMQGAVVSRYLRERSHHVYSFLEFRKTIHEMWAWYFAHFTSPSVEDYYYIHPPHNQAHVPFYIYQIEQEPRIMQNIINNNRENFDRVTLFQETTRFTNLCEHWFRGADILPRYKEDYGFDYPIKFPELETRQIGFELGATRIIQKQKLPSILIEMVKLNEA